MTPEYRSAYHRRFAWFSERGIEPRVPGGKARIGLLSPTKNKIPERLYLESTRESGKPFASFFLHDEKDCRGHQQHYNRKRDHRHRRAAE